MIMSTRMFCILALFATLLTGCTAPRLPAAQPVEFSVLYNERAAQPFQPDWLILDEYRKQQNVVLDVQTGDDADFARAIIQALESEDIPDIILKVWPEQAETYAASGLLLPFSDYEDKMPHFMAYIKQHGLEGELDKLRLDNGKYYILPGYRRQIQVQQWIYRQDLFAEHGLATPTTYDELFDALVYLKEQYPDSTPITTPWGGAHLLAMLGAGYGIPAGWAGVRDFNPETYTWRYAPATDEYRELHRFLHRAYAAGILDAEFFTQNDEEFTNKLTDGRAFATVTWITSGFKKWDEALHANGIPAGKWAPFPVPASTLGHKALPPVDPFRKGLIVPARMADDPDFERLLQFLDWAIYAEDGMALTTWGVKDVTYAETPNGKTFLPGPAASTGPVTDYTAAYGLETMFNLNENEEFEDFKKPAEIVEFLDASLAAEDAAPMEPNLKLDASAIEAIRLLNEKIDPYVANASHAFITGEMEIEADWDAYLQGLEKRGYTTLEEIWNSTWKTQTQP
jgi:putative aldouronate transport system substrate-binding protein